MLFIGVILLMILLVNAVVLLHDEMITILDKARFNVRDK
jgi:hypothetical protein